jgi:proline reductase-associated electron transfer protein PrdC
MKESIIKIPLKQHVGAPCQAVVQAGAKIKRGELIAEPKGLGARIHSSVDGEIADIDQDNIVIRVDAEQSESYQPIPDFSTNLEAVEFAGIVGAGGAGFPAHIKFNVDLEGGAVIANAAECEPILMHNVQHMSESAEEIVRGLKYVMEMTNASRGIIAIKPKHKAICAKFETLIKEEAQVEIGILPDMYPAGDERVIVRELVGVELKPGQLPLEAGAVVTNTETLKNVTRAIEKKRPVITKDLTVGGRVNDAKSGRVFMDVPIGTRVGDLIEACGGYALCSGEIVMGGPFTGKRSHEEASVNKTTGGILVAVEFPRDTRKVGVIACECGADEVRLREIAASMGAEVVAEEKCKRMTEVGGRFRCDLPGSCPGQTEKVLKLRKKGAEIILTGTCED